LTNTTRRFKLEYTDSSETVQTIAELGQDTGALSIDRFVEFKRKSDPDILKVWLEGDNFGNTIPTRKSEFGTASNGTDEPEIRLKQYNPDTSSFDLINRFYAKNKGTINENGELALKLYSFFKFTARQSVQTGTVNDTNGNGSVDIEDALNATLPTGYAADVPGSVTPPEVTGYSLDARREKGFHELTRDFKWAMTFTGNLDGSNNALVKYEPEGFGGTVDTLVSNEQAGAYRIIAVDTTNEIFTVPGDVTDLFAVDQAILVNGSTGNDGTYTITNLSYDSGNNETDITVSEDVTDSTADGQIIPGGQAIFKSWEKDKTDAIINKVKVEGTKPSDGTEVTGTATNQTQINNFGEKFLKVKRGYIESTSEAETIAESYLVPGLDDMGNDITTVPESGTVKTSVYSDNVVNDSFQVVDNTRNIDDTYTVVEQRNYWPEGATELEFEFEKENLEGAARESENLRDERARLYPSSQTDVGQQDFTGDTGSAPSDTNQLGSVTDAPSDTNVNGQVTDAPSDTNAIGGVQEHTNAELVTDSDTDTGSTALNANDWTFITNANNISNDSLFHQIFVIITDISSVTNLEIAVVQDDEFVIAHWTPDQVGNNNHDSLTGGTVGDDGYYANNAIVMPADFGGSLVDYNLYIASKGSATPTVDATITAYEINHFHPDDIDTQDNDHPHGDDFDTQDNDHPHGDDFDTQDNNHGGTGDPTGQHGASGTTDSKNVNVATEDKTDR